MAPSPDDDLPALLGGPPVRPQGPPGWPVPDPDVDDALRAAAADGSWGRYHGPHVPALEAALAEYHGVPFALTCSSGTLAVEAALRALKVGPGDEVLLAAYDYEANFLAAHALGATPVLIDVAPHNWNLDPEAIPAAAGPKAKALIVSHLHGGLVPMREVMEIAGRHGLAVVEDAAQAPGAVVQGRKAGAWGDAGVLSFGGSKLLSAGRGGAVLTRRADVYQRARLALRRGVQEWAALSELQAAVLLPQLRKLDERTARRAENARQLAEMLADVPGLVPFANRLPDAVPAYYKLGFRYDAAAFGLGRGRFAAALRAEGVAFGEGFRALHVGRNPNRFRAAGGLAEAARAHHGCVVLHHPVLLGGPEELAEVVRAVRKAYRNSQRLAADGIARQPPQGTEP
ncbi:MAG TPA: aminotransferase class I/II-fold pyridoxal phosphate-dependent enzyme [Gemmataceae bacterium]